MRRTVIAPPVCVLYMLLRCIIVDLPIVTAVYFKTVACAIIWPLERRRF